jgi:hypothetical protein
MGGKEKQTSKGACVGCVHAFITLLYHTLEENCASAEFDECVSIQAINI